MKIIFLDNQIWNYLIDGNSTYNEDQLLRTREQLASGIKVGAWEVICSLSVLQEVLGTYRKKPDKCMSMKNLVFSIVGDRWLPDIKERYVGELHRGGLLPQTKRYISRENIRNIKDLVGNIEEIIDINDATHKEALRFKGVHTEIKSKIYTDLGSLGGNPPKGIARVYENWFSDNQNFIRELVYRVLEGGAEQELFDKKMIDDFIPSFTNSPSAWRYVEFRQAKILANIGHNMKIESGDAVDADIYGCSPYYDVLVTHDERFRKTIELIGNKKFELYDFNQFMQFLLNEAETSI